MTHMDDNSDVAGFSADTEILTRGQGWITFDRLTCLDEVEGPSLASNSGRCFPKCDPSKRPEYC